jgi:hypothetical protein
MSIIIKGENYFRYTKDFTHEYSDSQWNLPTVGIRWEPGLRQIALTHVKLDFSLLSTSAPPPLTSKII